MDQNRILHLVEPDRSIGEALQKVLTEEGIPVRIWPDAERFLEEGALGSLDDTCLLVDADLPGASGISLVKTLRERGAGAPMILLTGAVDRELRARAIEAGATDVLERSLIDAFVLQRMAQLWPGATDPTRGRPAKVALDDGTLLTFRQITPEDADMVEEFVAGLSVSTRYLRFFSDIRELPETVLRDFTNPRYPISFAVIATVDEPDANGVTREREIGVARYAPTRDSDTAEFAIVVTDEWQRRGVATRLMRMLTTAAAVAGLRTLEGMVLRENQGMLDLCRGLGFLPSGSSGDPSVVRVARELRGDGTPDA